jgi:hypothetical protein
VFAEAGKMDVKKKASGVTEESRFGAYISSGAM